MTCPSVVVRICVYAVESEDIITPAIVIDDQIDDIMPSCTVLTEELVENIPKSDIKRSLLR